jgi:hypothetical protein
VKSFLALVACAFLLAGCPLTKPDSTEGQVAKIAVQYATAKYIGRVAAGERAARAERIAEVVDAVEAAAKGSELVTVPLLQEAIWKNLPSDLAPEDRVARTDRPHARWVAEGRPTARCQRRGRMGASSLQLLRWLDPARRPRDTHRVSHRSAWKNRRTGNLYDLRASSTYPITPVIHAMAVHAIHQNK